MRITEEVDANFIVNTEINKPDIVFHDVRSAPFRVYGLFYENGKFCRLPESVAKAVNHGVHFLHCVSAGGRVRFRTDSPYVAIHVETDETRRKDQFPLTATAGFDLYVREGQTEIYTNTFRPPLDFTDGYEGVITLGGKELREITINMPLYTTVKRLLIGLAESAVVEAPTPYALETPVVYYGSSITQGACASRPGNTYESMISRRLNCNFINLGFAGNALAEDEIAEYIKGLNMSVFVYDYDHNAPNPQYLRATHEKMFQTIRSALKDLPIVILSRPHPRLTADGQERLAIIKATYENAVAAGDRNVYFIPGTELVKYSGHDGLVDNCHPTDLGFASFAKVLGDLLETILTP